VTTSDKNVDISTSDEAGDDILSITPEKAATAGSMAEPFGEAAAAKSVTAAAGKKVVEPETGTAANSAVENAAKEVVRASSAKSGPPLTGVAEPAARGEATGQKKARMRSFPDRSSSSSSSLGFVSRFNSSASAPVSENEVAGDLTLYLGPCTVINNKFDGKQTFSLIIWGLFLQPRFDKRLWQLSKRLQCTNKGKWWEQVSLVILGIF
jgi:hypothetical protein